MDELDRRIARLRLGGFNATSALRDVLGILFEESDGTINPGKEWSADTLEALGEWAESYHLHPGGR